MNNYKRNKTSGRDDRREDRQMHKATCANCGKNCEVPFRPSGDKPIYCSNCFEKENKSRGGDRGRGRGDRGRPEMHKATCANCGKNCEVPFRPSGDKPVYCSNCFEKGSNSGSSKSPQSSKMHDEICEKLDEIISLLQKMNQVKEEPVVKKAAKKKKVAAKKTVKKVATKKETKKTKKTK